MTSSYLEEMKLAATESYGVVFMDFLNEYKYEDYQYYCFVEGEDSKYYDSRFERYLDSEKVRIYNSSGKSNVMKLHKKISNEENYKKIPTLFFVDRDFDFDLTTNGNLYVTPCYSIENLYTTKKGIEKIFEIEFSLKKHDTEFLSLIDTIENIREQYSKRSLLFNTLAYIKNKKKISNSLLKISKCKINFVVDFDREIVLKDDNYYREIKKMIDILDVSARDIKKTRKELLDRDDFRNDFRGKNELEFITKIINYYKIHYNKKVVEHNELVQSKMKTGVIKNKVTLNISSNKLTELNGYSNTPDCLKEFLLNNKVS